MKMSISLSKITLGWVLNTIVFLAALAATAAWIATALSFHVVGPALFMVYGALGLGILGAVAALFTSKRRGWAVLLMVLGIGIGWYQSLKPQEDRDWAFDVAHGVTARVDGDTVQLDKVRNFDWITRDSANASWEARSYDLEKLHSVDLVTSVWDSKDIAHVIVTFGFSDGQRVAFSVETRKEVHESFNVLGGFFRQFELVLIAATEEDILKLRTNHRKEDVRLYPLALSAEQRRVLILSYVALANQLEDRPAFYNTLTHNCTTTLYPLANAVHAEVGLDWRLMASGHLPDYIDELGGFQGDLTMEERTARAAITEIGQAADKDAYSEVIRQAYAVK